MKRAPRSRQRHDLYAKYHDYDSEISDLLGECGLHSPCSLAYELWNDPTSVFRPVAPILSPCGLHISRLFREREAFKNDGLTSLFDRKNGQRSSRRKPSLTQQQFGIIKQAASVLLSHRNSLRDLRRRERSGV